MIDVTRAVAAEIPADFEGAVLVHCKHTTAGITINENADRDVVHDLLAELERLVPWRNPAHRHGEGNSSAHLKASLVGSSVTVPVTRGQMDLGTWQAIFFCEFDGPRSRRVAVRLLPGC
jgi:secondary thiamine-phosphate synthase enzyme